MHLGYSWTLDETTAGTRTATTASIEVTQSQQDGNERCDSGRSQGNGFGLKAHYDILRECFFRVDALTYVFPAIAPASESLDALVIWNLNGNLNVQYS